MYFHARDMLFYLFVNSGLAPFELIREASFSVSGITFYLNNPAKYISYYLLKLILIHKKMLFKLL